MGNKNFMNINLECKRLIKDLIKLFILFILCGITYISGLLIKVMFPDFIDDRTLFYICGTLYGVWSGCITQK